MLLVGCDTLLKKNNNNKETSVPAVHPLLSYPQRTLLPRTTGDTPQHVCSFSILSNSSATGTLQTAGYSRPSSGQQEMESLKCFPRPCSCVNIANTWLNMLFVHAVSKFSVFKQQLQPAHFLFLPTGTGSFRPIHTRLAPSSRLPLSKAAPAASSSSAAASQLSSMDHFYIYIYYIYIAQNKIQT